MRKRKKKIYIRLLAIASMFIVALYSPIGSPDLYNSDTNYFQDRFNSTEIKAIANKIGSESIVAISVPADKVKPLTSIPGSTKIKSNVSGYSVAHLETNTVGITNFAAISEQNTVMSGANNFNPLSTEQSAIPGITKPSVSNLSSTSFYANKDLSSFDTNNSLMGVDYTANAGATDPGGILLNSTSELTIIPIGDGYGYLFLLGVFYFAIKRLKMI